MSPAHITAYLTTTGKRRYRVEYRLGGRGTRKMHGGSFPSKREAEARRGVIAMALARGEDPRTTVLAAPVDVERVTLTMAAGRWEASRHDIAESTAKRYHAQIAHSLEKWGTRAPESITAAEVSEWVGELIAKKTAPEYTRKLVRVLAMVLDHHGVSPNPVKDSRVKMPRSRRKDVDAPESGILVTTFGAMPPRYVLAALVLETTAMRVSELEGLTWADVDAPRLQLRVNIGRAKTAAGGRWVPVPADVLEAIEALMPREDRDLGRRVMPWLDQAAMRTAIRRAVTATGSADWSPHGLRRRRISLWHRAGISWAQIGEWAGQRDLAVTANTYTRVMVGAEIDRAPWLEKARTGVRG